MKFPVPVVVAVSNTIAAVEDIFYQSGAETTEIKAAVEKMQNRSDQYIHRQHQIERYRDLLIEGDKQVFQTLVTSCPGIDVQHLRQLIRAAQKEREENKPAASARKLFGFIREQLELHD